MTKREICESKPSIAYYSGFNGLEVKSIIHGINIEMYAVSNSWGGGKKLIINCGFIQTKMVNTCAYTVIHAI